MKICPECRLEYADDKLYCGNCGSLLITKPEEKPQDETRSDDARTTGSRGAGRGLKAALVVLCVALLGLGAFSAYKINDLNNDLDFQRRQASSYKDERDEYKDELDEYKALSEQYQGTVDFFNEYARVVSDDDSGLYHRYGCEDCDTSYFWIYNVNMAKTKAEPCPKCCSDDMAE